MALRFVVWSRTTKQTSCSSTSHGGGKRRGAIIVRCPFRAEAVPLALPARSLAYAGLGEGLSDTGQQIRTYQRPSMADSDMDTGGGLAAASP